LQGSTRGAPAGADIIVGAKRFQLLAAE